MELYNSFAIIIVLAAIFGYLNFRFLKFPTIIGVMTISLVTSLCIVLIGKVYPELFGHYIQLIKSVDFDTILIKIMLSFLLFAVSIHIKMINIKKER